MNKKIWRVLGNKRLFFLIGLLCLILLGVASAQAVNQTGINEVVALSAHQSKLTASDGMESDQFGYAVAIDGETAVIGAFAGDGIVAGSGAAYVYTVSNGTWSQQQKLIANDGALSDKFGWSVAISGDTIIVGSSWDEDNGSESGSVYTFTRSGAVWSQQQKLTSSDNAQGDQFGRSVTIDGETAVIGAYRDVVDGKDGHGSAYVFTRSGAVWSEQQKITSNDGAEYDQFGVAVAISGETAVIGSHRDDDDGSNSGSAYMFTRSGVTWSQQQKLTATDATAFNSFGTSVAIDGETAVIGTYIGAAARPLSAPNNANRSSNVDKGGAYIFTRSGATWSQQQKLISDDSTATDFFGVSVDIDGNMISVGAWGDDDNGLNSGSVYLFSRVGAMWNRHQKIIYDDGTATQDRFGISVALADRMVIGGAFGDDDFSGSAVVTAVTFATYLPFVINP